MDNSANIPGIASLADVPVTDHLKVFACALAGAEALLFPREGHAYWIGANLEGDQADIQALDGSGNLIALEDGAEAAEIACAARGSVVRRGASAESHKIICTPVVSCGRRVGVLALKTASDATPELATGLSRVASTAGALFASVRLADAARDILTPESEKNPLKPVFDAVHDLLHVDNCLIAGRSFERDAFSLVDIHGFNMLGIGYGAEFSHGDSICGALLSQGTLLIDDYAKEYTRYPSRFRQRLDHGNLYAFLGIQLVQDGELRGALLLGHRHQGYFTPSDIVLAKAIGGVACTALQRRLALSTGSHIATLNELHKVSYQDVPDISSTIARVGDILCKHVKADCVQIGIAQNTGIVLYYNKGWDPEELGESRDSDNRPVLSGGILGRVVDTGRTCDLRDVLDTQQEYASDYKAYQPATRSEVAVAIKDEFGNSRGVINLEHHEIQHFSNSEITLLESVAHSLANLLVQRSLLDFARELSNIVGVQDYEVALRRIAEAAAKILSADAVSIFELDESGEGVRIGARIASGPWIGEQTAEQATRREEVVRNIIREERSVFLGSSSCASDRSGIEESWLKELFDVESILSCAALALKGPSGTGGERESERKGRAVGVLAIGYRAPVAVAKQQQYLDLLAQLAGRAIVAARQRRRARDLLRSLNEFGATLHAYESPDDLWKAVAEGLQSTLGCEAVSVFLFDKAAASLRHSFTARFELAATDTPPGDMSYYPGEGVTGQAFVTKPDDPAEQSLYVGVNGIQPGDGVLLVKETLVSREFTDLVLTPVRDDEQPIGVIRVMNRIDHVEGGVPVLSTGRVPEEDRDAIAEMVRMASEAYARILLLGTQQAVAALARTAVTSLEVERLCRSTVCELTGRYFNYRAVFVRTRDARGNLALAAASLAGERGAVDRDALEGKYPGVKTLEVPGIGEAAGQTSIAGQVGKTGSEVYVADVQAPTSGFGIPALARDLALRSCECIPLMVGDQSVGTIAVYSGSGENGMGRPYVFTGAEKRALRSIADLLALAVRHAETYSKYGTFFKIVEAAQSCETPEAALADILTGITCREGLGFNRAVILRQDGESPIVQALVVAGAIGEVSKAEWERACARLQVQPLEEILKSNDAMTPLALSLRGLSVTYSATDPLLGSISMGCFIHRVTDEDVKASAIGQVWTRLWPETDGGEFAMVPIILSGDRELLVGYVYVDNGFDRRPIDQHVVETLCTFGNFAGWTMRRYDEMEMKDRLIVDIGHHLKTPLVSIVQKLDDLQAHLEARAHIHDLLLDRIDWQRIEDSRRNAYIGGIMVDKILHLRRLRGTGASAPKTEQYLQGIALGAMAIFPDYYRQRIQANVPGRVKARTNHDLAMIGLFEILHNALKYSGTERVDIVGGTEGGRAFLEVRDHGPGIPPAYIKDIYKLYWKDPDLKAAKGEIGLGLGLYLVDNYIRDQLGHELMCMSAIGRGTTFRIMF